MSIVSKPGQGLQEHFQSALSKTHKKLRVTGMAGVVLRRGEIIAQAIDGHRKHGDETPVKLDDKWHIGSITKSMTSLLLGKLVERGQLSFDDKLPDVMGRFKAEMHEDWHEVTVSQLLLMRSGMRGNFVNRIMNTRDFADAAALREARHGAVLEVLREKPETEPGRSYIYSNAAYTTAGVIAELITGKSWEDLLREELFQPLKLKSAGFGTPYGDGPVDQPWGHKRSWWSKAPLDPRSPQSDNSHIIGPAGIVHMSLQDLVKYGYEHLQGLNGRSDLLSQPTFRQLHTGEKIGPFSGQIKIAMGWASNNSFKPYNGQKLIMANGSNTLWYATLILLPDTDMVIAIAANEVASMGKMEAGFMMLGQDVIGGVGD